MIGIIKKTINDNWKLLVITSAILLSFVVLFVGFFPEIQKNASTYEEILGGDQGYGNAIEALSGVEDPIAFTQSLETFMTLEYVSIIWPIAAITIAIGFASTILAKEIERGNIIILLSQPIARWKLFLAKYKTALTMILIFCLLTILPVIPIASVLSVDAKPEVYLIISIWSFVFTWVFFALATAISTKFSDSGLVTATGIGFAIISYGINIVSRLEDSLENLKYFSVFYYFDFNYAVEELAFDWTKVGVLFMIAVVLSLYSFWNFVNRDFS